MIKQLNISTTVSKNIFSVILVSTLYTPGVHADPVSEIQSLIDSEEYGIAVSHSNKALASDPGNISLLLVKEFSLLKLERFNEVEELYQQVTETYPNNPSVKSAIATAALKQGHFEDAIARY